jgi:hypothetical protein
MSCGWPVTHCHKSSSAWIPHVLQAASHVSLLGPAVAVHLFPFQPAGTTLLKKGHRVEVSSHEEGLTRTLFPAIVFQKVGNGHGFLIEYRDLMTEDGKSKLRETVQAHHVRPEPSALNRKCFFLREEVDAYDHDG